MSDLDEDDKVAIKIFAAQLMKARQLIGVNIVLDPTIKDEGMRFDVFVNEEIYEALAKEGFFDT